MHITDPAIVFPYNFPLFDMITPGKVNSSQERNYSICSKAPVAKKYYLVNFIIPSLSKKIIFCKWRSCQSYRLI